MNNKGFAISTLVYGLSIMGIMIVAIAMGTMAASRTNIREVNNSVEEELLSYNATEEVFSASTNSQPFLVAEGQSGWYRIELWGAQGGPEAYGAYTSGVIKLTEGETLYFNVGIKGSPATAGESTDVRIIDGGKTDPASYSTRIMVAGGGGIGNGAVGGTIVGYSSISRALGGKVNDQGQFEGTGTLVGYQEGYKTVDLKAPEYGIEGPSGMNGGGGGYYSSIKGNYGGLSYIAGYAGSGEAITVTEIISKVDDSEENMADAVIIEEPVTREFYFLDGRMFAGVNEGEGKAKITKLVNLDENDTSKTIPIVNKKLKGIKEVRDCLPATDGKNNGITVDNSAYKEDIVVMKDGKKLAGTATYDSINKCKVFTLLNNSDVDEIAVWHTKDGVDYYDHTIEVTDNPGNESSWKKIKGIGNKLQSEGSEYVTKLSETETPTGFHISAYQYDSTESLPKNGNYYIMPVLQENKVITAQSKGDSDQNSLIVSGINGEASQIWSIELLDNKLREKDPAGNYYLEYKVVELSRYKAMTIHQDENRLNNEISAPATFNNYSRNDPQIWRIKAVGNGTYVIETPILKFQMNEETGYIYPDNNENPPKMKIGLKDINGQRYRLISTEYSIS